MRFFLLIIIIIIIIVIVITIKIITITTTTTTTITMKIRYLTLGMDSSGQEIQYYCRAEKKSLINIRGISIKKVLSCFFISLGCRGQWFLRCHDGSISYVGKLHTHTYTHTHIHTQIINIYLYIYILII